MQRAIACAIAALCLASSACGEELVSKEACKPCKTGAKADSPEHGKINTADATPVCPGHIELEFGYDFKHAARKWNNDRSLKKRGSEREHAATVALTAGIIPNLDFNLSCGCASIRDAENDFDPDDTVAGPQRGEGIGDTRAGARWRFLTLEKHALEVAWITGLTIPTGRRSTRSHIGTSQEFWSWKNSLVVSKDWGKWTASAETGYSLPFGEEREEARGTATANIAAGYQVLKRLQPEVEINCASDFVRRGSGANVLAATAGLKMPLNERLSISAGVQQALTGRNTDQNTTLLLRVKLAW